MYVSQTDPKERVFWLARLTLMLENCVQAVGKAYRAGAKLGFGTDSAPMSLQYEEGVEKGKLVKGGNDRWQRLKRKLRNLAWNFPLLQVPWQIM